MEQYEMAAAVMGCPVELAHAMDGATIMVGTPTYGGSMETSHANSLELFAYVCGVLKLPYSRVRPQGESLVQRARNRIVRDFMATHATHLMFIDADIKFEPWHIFRLFQAKKRIVGAAYPRKQIDFAAVARAAARGEPAPEQYGSSMVWNPHPDDSKSGTIEFDSTGCHRALDAPTGFLLIERSLIEDMIKRYPETEYRDDTGVDGAVLWALFDTGIVSGQYLSEDWWFSRKVREMGETVWLCPDINLGHIGKHHFVGSPKQYLRPLEGK